jgi:hypothetical protein
MAESQEPAKTLEMRVAAIEDKLSKISVTEHELRTYQKVASLAATQSAFTCIISQLCHIISIPISVPVTIPTPIISDCIQFSASTASGSAGFQNLGQS